MTLFCISFFFQQIWKKINNAKCTYMTAQNEAVIISHFNSTETSWKCCYSKAIKTLERYKSMRPLFGTLLTATQTFLLEFIVFRCPWRGFSVQILPFLRVIKDSHKTGKLQHGKAETKQLKNFLSTVAGSHIHITTGKKVRGSVERTWMKMWRKFYFPRD